MYSKLNNLKLICIAFLFATVLVSCNNDDDGLQDTEFTLSLNMPSGVENISIKDISIHIKDQSSGAVETITEVTNNSAMVFLPQGTYEVSVSGNIDYDLDGKTKTASIQGFKESVPLVNMQESASIDLFLSIIQNDFIIEEIFYTGTLSPDGKQYDGDKYIKLRNSSDKILYADGVAIAQSEFMTVEIKNDLAPDIRNDKFAITDLTIVPGSGKEHPVQPGGTFVVAIDAANHKELNSNSLDLSNADMEIFWADLEDVDNPAVPNMIEAYSFQIFHNRGFRSFAIARMPVSLEQFKADHAYEYTWEFVFGDIRIPQEDETFAIPNEWVLDAVNLSVESEFLMLPTSPALDSGWTYCGKVDKDPTRYGKSVRRKELGKDIDGNPIFKDTNNSTLDFEAEAQPSLMQTN
ncbi:MAG: DUF4876 domain-containing protein [Flavobacteriaceae bacterium]|nr:DUF4876 domain-containing protein [Flavobacteriaceae bacterium]